MMLVTLAQARDHLRSDTDADDADLTGKIQAASDAVLDYVGALVPRDTAGDPLTDTSGELIGVPERVLSRLREATLATVGYMYRERAGSREYAVPTAWGYGYTLPEGPTALLYSLRRPTVG